MSFARVWRRLKPGKEYKEPRLLFIIKNYRRNCESSAMCFYAIVGAAVSEFPAHQDASRLFDRLAKMEDELAMVRELLSADELEIFELQLKGYTDREISKRLDCALQTVLIRANRIDDRLRAWAEEHHSHRDR